MQVWSYQPALFMSNGAFLSLPLSLSLSLFKHLMANIKQWYSNHWLWSQAQRYSIKPSFSLLLIGHTALSLSLSLSQSLCLFRPLSLSICACSLLNSLLLSFWFALVLAFSFSLSFSGQRASLSSPGTLPVSPSPPPLLSPSLSLWLMALPFGKRKKRNRTREERRAVKHWKSDTLTKEDTSTYMHKTLHTCKGSWVIKCAEGEALTEGDADTFLHMSTQTNINTQTHTLSKLNKKAVYGASDYFTQKRFFTIFTHTH